MVSIRQGRPLLCSKRKCRANPRPADGAPVPRQHRISTDHARGSFPKFPLATFITVSSYARPSPKLQSTGFSLSAIAVYSFGSNYSSDVQSPDVHSSDCQSSDEHSSGLNINNIRTFFPCCVVIVYDITV